MTGSCGKTRAVAAGRRFSCVLRGTLTSAHESPWPDPPTTLFPKETLQLSARFGSLTPQIRRIGANHTVAPGLVKGPRCLLLLFTTPLTPSPNHNIPAGRTQEGDGANSRQSLHFRGPSQRKQRARERVSHIHGCDLSAQSRPSSARAPVFPGLALPQERWTRWRAEGELKMQTMLRSIPRDGQLLLKISITVCVLRQVQARKTKVCEYVK